MGWKIAAERFMTSRILCLLGIGLYCLSACAAPAPPPATAAEAPPPAIPVQWRAIARPEHAGLIDGLPDRWAAARAGLGKSRQALVASFGALLEPGAALVRPMPPTGRYRCRTLRFAPDRPGGFQAYQSWFCFVGDDGDLTTLSKADGSDRPAGRLWPDGDRRMVFIGATAFDAEPAPPAYGDRAEADTVGVVERVADFQWRLVLPRGAAGLDVLELVPDVPPPPPAGTAR